MISDQAKDFAEVTGFCDEINNEFETSGKYSLLVSQTMRPIAKSMLKTLDVKSTIFEHRIGFLRQNHLPTLNPHEAFLCLAESFLVTRTQPHTCQHIR